MSTLTSTLPPNSYRDTTVETASRPVARPQKQHGVFARVMARLIASRQRQAMIELQRHGLRLPSELEQAGGKLSERNEDSLPFVR